MGDTVQITHNTESGVAILLPELSEEVTRVPDVITRALGIPRDVLASEEEIECAWQGIPRELRAVQGRYVEQLAPMCVALSVGLFDSAINYIWNATVITLRERVRDFGLPIVQSIKGSAFEEKELIGLPDAVLLRLCAELGVLEEDAFYFLDQCRDIRNKCSAAHPAIAKINDREFLNYFNRCVRYALGDSSTVRGVDVHAFINTMKASRFSDDQLTGWVEQARAAYAMQQRLLVETAYGLYCDLDTEEFARQNALDYCRLMASDFDSETKSMLINRHNEYRTKGDTSRYKASMRFFEALQLVGLLDFAERHALVSSAAKRLWEVHLGIDNFYNEPPFAERLLMISKQSAIPETVQEEYVQVVVHCYLGNYYGVSWGAEQYYADMIASFSEKEIAIMLKRSQTTERMSLGEAARNHKERFRSALKLIDPNSVPSIVKDAYREWLRS